MREFRVGTVMNDDVITVHADLFDITATQTGHGTVINGLFYRNEDGAGRVLAHYVRNPASVIEVIDGYEYFEDNELAQERTRQAEESAEQ